MAQARILIVEDDALVAADLSHTLEELGFGVAAVLNSSAGAVDAARELDIDVALLDIRLGGPMDGTALGKVLGEELDLPVVYLTAFSDDATLERIRHSGSSGYLLKPFRREELRAVLALSLDAHGSRKQLRSSEERYRILFEQSLAGVLRKTADGTILDCNDAFCKILGYDEPAELIGCSAEILYPSLEERERFRQRLDRDHVVRNFELRMRRKDETPVWVLDNSALIQETGRDGLTVLSTVLDITERKSLESALKDMAYRDPLTGLPNRRHLQEMAPQILALALRRKENVGLFFLDVVGFKKVNDRYGHRCGDAVLIEIGRRLEREVRAADALARLGGDEFATLMLGVADGETAAQTARRIIQSIEEPVTFEGQEVRVSGRFGVSIFPDQGETFDTLFARADQAVALAKAQGGSAVVVAGTNHG